MFTISDELAKAFTLGRGEEELSLKIKEFQKRKNGIGKRIEKMLN